MAIVAFWSEEKNETGQTLSMVALSTYMAIEHNLRILNVSTNFKDDTLENCYWDIQENESIVKDILGNDRLTGVDSGIEGLVKLMNSNRLQATDIYDYTKVVFKERLDILCSPKATEYNEYLQIIQKYPDLLKITDHCYDLVFIDISKRMDEREVNKILEVSDIIIVNITQKLKVIEKFSKLRQENNFFKNNNIILNIGRYDSYSKYNTKNISRYLKTKTKITDIPYNTLFFESCSEGRVSEYFWKLRKIGDDDKNQIFINHLEQMSKVLIYKIQELQMNI